MNEEKSDLLKYDFYFFNLSGNYAKKQSKNLFLKLKIILIRVKIFFCLFGCYGISTFVGYFIPNPFL